MGAATFDVSSIVTKIGEIPVVEIGMALLGMAVLAVGIKWAKAALFG